MRRFGPALAERDFALLWFALLGMGISLQMLEVAIGWEVYSAHRSALDLGWIGLAEFVPMFALALPAGQLADRFPRRRVLLCSLALSALVALGLVWLSSSTVASVWPFLALAMGAGTATAIGTPAARALPPTLVGPDLLESAMALRSIAVQSAQVVGPALGGLLYQVSPGAVYGLAAAMCVAAAGCVAAMRRSPAADAVQGTHSAPGLGSVLAGIRFVRHSEIVFGAILLDLMAVLFGGAVALLPLFALSILHVGPIGLGVLRSAPAVGALLAAAILTRRSLGANAGRKLLFVVGVFGVSTIVFGLSRSFPLSLLALAVGGFADMFSVNIRSTTVALATPDPLRGRVLAVEMVFISASNQLGAFESGVAAFFLGAVPAVVAGGALTVVIALGWSRLFPALAAVDRLKDLRPAEAAAPFEVTAQV
jgi:MFS family permease